MRKHASGPTTAGLSGTAAITGGTIDFTGAGAGFADGAAATPSIPFASDNDGSGTGFYRAAANQIGIANNGTAQWVIGTTGTLTAQGNQNISMGGSSVLTNGASSAFTLNSGKLTKYNGVTTAGFGVAAVAAAGRVTAQAAAAASVSTYTVGASDGSFEVSANVLVTTATNHNFTVTCAYTDEGNTARTVTMTFRLVASPTTLTTAIANANGAVPYQGDFLHIRCKAATTITVATTGTFTTVAYNAEAIIKQTA